jgi:diguanylate cyclase (GGDEF)-like protein
MQKNPPEGTDAKPAPARILVADDSVVVRAIVRHGLAQAGHKIDEAANGAEALRLLEAHSYDAVVTDLRMPEVDGFGVLSAIKERGLDTEVIILTASCKDDMRSAVRALRLGAHDYLTKPLASAEEMVMTVERAVEKKRLSEANKRLIRELAALSRTDTLTGLANRRAFEEALRGEVMRARRYRVPLSLLMLDLDHFKKVNDTYGHPGGDAVLRDFAAIIRGVFRDTDAAFRYGGEEFAVLLPHSTAEHAERAAERLLAEVRRARIQVGSTTLKVTCSIGIADLRAGDGDAQEMLRRADAALYRAKAAGRDRAKVFVPAEASQRAAAGVTGRVESARAGLRSPA